MPAAFVGAFNAVALFPVVVAMHVTKYEDLSIITPKVFFLIFVKGIFDNVISDMLWARAIMLTSPTIATVGSYARRLVAEPRMGVIVVPRPFPPPRRSSPLTSPFGRQRINGAGWRCCDAVVPPSALSLTIPLSMLADWMFKSEVPTKYLWAGSFCVILGFLAVSVQPAGIQQAVVTAAAEDGYNSRPMSATSLTGRPLEGSSTSPSPSPREAFSVEALPVI
jgi:hypothetical protein